MTGSEGHRARMGSDTPRGYGVRSDVRKRLEGQHQEHPDAAVRDLLAKAREEAWESGWFAGMTDSLRTGGPMAHNPYRSAS